MNRSDLPDAAGYFYLFASISSLVTFYWVYASEQVRAAPLYPGSTMPITWQWALNGACTLVNLICAAALLQRRSWAKAAVLAQLVAAALLIWFLSTGKLVVDAWWMFISAVPLLMICRAPIIAIPQRRISRSQRVGRIAGFGIYICATLAMYVTVASLFSGTSPTATSPAMTSSGAIVCLGMALAVMWFGSLLWGDKDLAREVAGVLLTAFASFMLLQCVNAFVYVRVSHPQVRGLFHWDPTMQILVILAIIGFTLVGKSRNK
ncbi:hypothetical protein [Cupriavidus sp. SW-Y-13]|uniref:hypothetical protein n=1 Tax=Cupriavidus sp. SW-Y-13 TaxID=2653854 RepID=UPI0013661F93|nr:hypothetical protein [Cupriavidus sp. SW-Y-13]MWL87138.1 hypothetical protein [Cupriavidus sp. SW-Y-13]